MQKNSFQVPDEILATHGQRFAHYLIDSIFEYILGIVLLVVIASIATVLGNKELIARIGTISQIEATMFLVVVILVYTNVTEILFSRTPAKFITGTIVVYEDGTRPNSDTILIRSACRLIPFEHFSYLLTPSRGWHDTLSKTYVVNKKKLEEKMTAHYGIPQKADIEEIVELPKEL